MVSAYLAKVPPHAVGLQFLHRRLAVDIVGELDGVAPFVRQDEFGHVIAVAVFLLLQEAGADADGVRSARHRAELGFAAGVLVDVNRRPRVTAEEAADLIGAGLDIAIVHRGCHHQGRQAGQHGNPD